MKYTVFTCVFLMLIFSCKKRVDILKVEVEKKASWTNDQRFSGIENIILSSGSDGNTIFLQQPYSFTTLRSQNQATGVTIWGAGLPTAIDVRIPIAPTFSPYMIRDTILRIMNNRHPNTSPSGGYLNLKAIDPTFAAIQKTSSFRFKSMAVNSTGVLLLSYLNNRPTHPLTFMLIKAKISEGYPYADTVFSKIITIPRTSIDAYVRNFTAINDYFLAYMPSNGLYKIKEDGSFAKVHSGATVNAFYEWQGKVYAPAEWDRLLTSSDQGDSWQESRGISDAMVLSSYYQLQDSLIGVNGANIFTLKWNATSYQMRALKNDGLEGSSVSGLELLHDTVYVATTKGLFYKHSKAFFESK